MKPELLKQLIGEQQKTQASMLDMIKKRDKEIKENGEANTKNADEIDKLGKKFDDLGKEINEILAKGQIPNGGQKSETPGQIFAGSDMMKNFSGDISEVRGKSIDVKSFGGQKSTPISSGMTGAGNGGINVMPLRLPEIIDESERTLSIRNLLPSQPISTNAIEYVRIIDFINSADIRPEMEHAKQSTMEFDLQTASVKTISHFMAASREILNDFNRMSAFIDSKLRYGVKAAEDRKLLYGSGTGGDFTGLMVDSDIQTYNRGKAGDSPIDTLRRSITQMQIGDLYSATGFLMNPIDWEAIELAKGSDGHYVWLNIGSGNQPQLFRLPVIATPAMEANNFLMGNFTQGATIYDREQAHVRVSESHEDYFTKGMLAMLGEERFAFAIERPKAFVKGTFDSGEAPGGGEIG